MLRFLDSTLIFRITKQICAEKESKIKILPMYGFVAQGYQYCVAQERGHRVKKMSSLLCDVGHRRGTQVSSIDRLRLLCMFPVKLPSQPDKIFSERCYRYSKTQNTSGQKSCW